MDLIDRFRYIMKLNQLTASAFADEIGVQRSSVSHVLSGRNKPGLEFIQKVLNTYPKVDANWLINGTTKVDVKQSAGELDFSKETEENTTAVTGSEESQSSFAEETKEKREKTSVETEFQANSTKMVERIIVFYSDQTFETFTK